jgi:dihydroorotate dehydrogenase
VSLYGLARPLLFALDPETAHSVTLRLADAFTFLPFPLFGGSKTLGNPVKAMGLDFPNPVGLAAGLDKDAAHIDALATLGFGFMEVGTVTPRPQPGNTRPRLFRIPAREALVNRFGFNNVGVDEFLRNIERSRYGTSGGGILGINIGRNADTPPERAAQDYEIGLEKVYAKASYVTVNISSPNTKGLRSLQERDSVNDLLARLSLLREKLTERHGRRAPLALKVSPDLDGDEVRDIADAVKRHRIDAVIATNTTLSRDGVQGLVHGNESGGLSGAPVLARSTAVLHLFKKELKNEVALIGSGGILSKDDARQKIDAGASLVQLYTGLIYRGPGLVPECVSAFRAK